jgi:hypothetical protein
MTGQSEMFGALPKAFWIALLLTGSIEIAEAAVLAGIVALEFNHLTGDRLLLATARSAVQRRTGSSEQSEELSILPLELRHLFLIAPNYRDCFVLRILIGLTPELCSEILRLSIHEIEDALFTVLQELPGIETCDMDRRESVHSAQDEKVDSCTAPSGANAWLLTR